MLALSRVSLVVLGSSLVGASRYENIMAGRDAVQEHAELAKGFAGLADLAGYEGHGRKIAGVAAAADTSLGVFNYAHDFLQELELNEVLAEVHTLEDTDELIGRSRLEAERQQLEERLPANRSEGYCNNDGTMNPRVYEQNRSRFYKRWGPSDSLVVKKVGFGWDDLRQNLDDVASATGF